MLITYSLANTSQTLHTHTCLTALFPRLTRWAGTRKVKPIWILLKQETVNSSGISWASTPPLCFYRPDALPAAQPTASKHWRQENVKVTNIIQKKQAASLSENASTCTHPMHAHTKYTCAYTTLNHTAYSPMYWMSGGIKNLNLTTHNLRTARVCAIVHNCHTALSNSDHLPS